MAVAGNLTLTRVDGVSPLRRNTSLVLQIRSYAGEMIINLHAPPAFLRREGQKFLEEFKARLVNYGSSETVSVNPIAAETAVSGVTREETK